VNWNNENCQEEEESLFMSQRVWRHQAAKKRTKSGRYLIFKISVAMPFLFNSSMKQINHFTIFFISTNDTSQTATDLLSR